MLSSIKIIAGLLLAGYVLICLLLFVAQRSIIYHPQPRSQASVPVLVLRHDGAVLKISHQPKEAARAVLYFGGNAEDVSASVPQLSLAFPDAAIYALHYRSFGGSEGQPSEQALSTQPKLYNPRHPESTLLYQTIAEHYETWLDLASAGQWH